MSKKEVVIERLVLLGILVVLYTITFAVFEALAYTVPEPIHVMRSPYPDIPQCDKELWLRIKDGCKDDTTTD